LTILDKSDMVYLNLKTLLCLFCRYCACWTS